MNSNTLRIDQFLLTHSSRADSWRDINALAADWIAGRSDRAGLKAAPGAMVASEEFHADPGARMLGTHGKRIAANDAAGAALLARQISTALMTRTFRDRPHDWDQEGKASLELAEVLPSTLGEHRARRPYSEVLRVTSQPANRGPALAAELRRMRRPDGDFVYERERGLKQLKPDAISAKSRR